MGEPKELKPKETTMGKPKELKPKEPKYMKTIKGSLIIGVRVIDDTFFDLSNKELEMDEVKRALEIGLIKVK